MYARLPSRHRGLRGFGDATTTACAANAVFNVESQQCLCNPWFESDDPSSKPCTPIDPKKPCGNGKFRVASDGSCDCPPGMIWNPDPSQNNCVPGRWFPTCTDPAGNRIPNCLFGDPMTDSALFITGGIVLGLALGLAFFTKH